MTECFLSDQEIRKLNRDLRILIAANGTLTRVLNIVADDEVIVQIVKQRIHDVSPKLSEFEQLGQVGVGRVLQRYIILKGRNSEHLFVAAESLIAIDRLPAAIITRLTQTNDPLGEVMAASHIETFKEEANSLGRRFARLARAPRVSEFPKESRCPPLSRYFRRPADHGGDGALSTKRISRCSA